MHRLAALLCLLPACTPFSSTATIYRLRQPTYEARIVDGDREAIVVEDHQGGRHRVPRGEVTHVDHPGNVLGGFGAAFTVLGGALAYNAVFDWDDERDDPDRDRDAAYMTAAFFGAVGIAMLVGGGRAWWQSREAVGRVDTRPGAQPPVVPIVPEARPRF